MTDREALALYELRCRKHIQQGGRCAICGNYVHLAFFQLGHRIPQRKDMIQKYGSRIIYHPRNMVGTCSLNCNGKVQLTPDSMEEKALAESIRGDITAGR
jgi:hypothetical protein